MANAMLKARKAVKVIEVAQGTIEWFEARMGIPTASGV